MVEIVKFSVFGEEKKPGVYCGFKLDKEDAKHLVKWAKGEGVKNVYEPDDMHVTLAYSRDYFEYEPEGILKDPIVTKTREPKFLGKDKNVLVMTLESKELQKRFKECIDAGASYDFPDYIPHVTISGDPGDIKLEHLEPLRTTITLVSDYSELLDLEKKT